MKNFLWLFLLVLSLSPVDAYAGFFFGGTYWVPKGAGLAGGAMVLGYAGLGLLSGIIVGVVVVIKLKGQSLRRAALALAIPVLGGYLILAVHAVSKRMANIEPDEAFVAAGRFTAVMERLDTSDPYLFVKMEIDSDQRTWTQTGPAPDHNVYYATMKADTLVNIRVGLDAVAALGADEFADCEKTSGEAIKRLRWDFQDVSNSQGGTATSRSGIINASEQCLRELFVISRALSLIEKAPSAPGGEVKRQ